MDVEEQFLDYVPVGELMMILRSYATRQLVSLGGTMVGRGIRFLNAQTCSKLIEQIQDNAFFHQDFWFGHARVADGAEPKQLIQPCFLLALPVFVVHPVVPHPQS